MSLPTTFGQLQTVIKRQILEGMSVGYYFLAGILETYLNIDADRESPRFPCHQIDILGDETQNDEVYERALNEMSLTDDFWEYVENSADILTEPIDRSIDTPERDDKYWDAVENHNQDGGNDILRFIERYRETTQV